jgi:hypothetical protein
MEASEERLGGAARSTRQPGGEGGHLVRARNHNKTFGGRKARRWAERSLPGALAAKGAAAGRSPAAPRGDPYPPGGTRFLCAWAKRLPHAGGRQPGPDPSGSGLRIAPSRFRVGRLRLWLARPDAGSARRRFSPWPGLRRLAGCCPRRLWRPQGRRRSGSAATHRHRPPRSVARRDEALASRAGKAGRRAAETAGAPGRPGSGASASAPRARPGRTPPGRDWAGRASSARFRAAGVPDRPCSPLAGARPGPPPIPSRAKSPRPTCPRPTCRGPPMAPSNPRRTHRIPSPRPRLRFSAVGCCAQATGFGPAQPKGAAAPSAASPAGLARLRACPQRRVPPDPHLGRGGTRGRGLAASGFRVRASSPGPRSRCAVATPNSDLPSRRRRPGGHVHFS